MLLVAPNQSAPPLADQPAGEQLPPITSPAEFAKAIAETMMEAHDRFYVEQGNYARTIPIPTLGVRTTQFDIDKDLASRLFDSGATAARQFLDSWDFGAYVGRYRKGTPPSRRETVLGPTRGAPPPPASAELT